MYNRATTFKTIEELDALLDEMRSWQLLGRRHADLGRAETLREAIRLAAGTSRWGARVVSIAREPDHDIIVFSAQMEELGRMMAETAG